MKTFKVVERKTVRTEIVDKYLTDISRIPILTPNQEYEIAVRARSGDQEAKQILVNSNLRFVVSVAKAYSNSKAPLMDLISQGNMGLVEAVDQFDPSTGFKFISYAVWHIRKNIFKYLNEHTRAVKLPQNVVNSVSRMKEIDARYNQLYERDATFEEMREELANLPVKTKYTTNPDILMAGMRADRYAMPLELRNGEDSDLVSAPISWLQSEDDSLEVLEKTDSEFLANLLLTALNPTERQVVMARLGKKTGFQLSFSEISEEFSKTPEWARSIFNKAIKKMQIRAKRSKVVKDHLK